MLPCPMETRATANRVPPAAYWRTIQIPRISAQDGESARPLRGARLAKESGGSATTLLSGRGIGGSAAMLPNAPFSLSLLEETWGRVDKSAARVKAQVSVSMCHVRGQFLTNADLFDPRDHLTYNRIQLSSGPSHQSLKLALSSAPIAVPPNPAVEPLSRPRFSVTN